MKNTEILKLLNENRIGELKSKIIDEISMETLSNTNEKNRFKNKVKFYTFVNFGTYNFKPFIHNNMLYLYSNHAVAITKETLCNLNYENNEINVKNIIDVTNEILGRNFDINRKINVKKLILDAKIKGFKMNKTELFHMQSAFLLHLNGNYWRLSVLYNAFRVVEDEKTCELLCCTSYKAPALILRTNVGVAMATPIFNNSIKNPNIIEINEYFA